jgi:osmotically-inducible protein OsmY
MDDKILRQNIIYELDWDPSIDSADIGVAVDRGVATLTGHVPNYAQKFAAETAVKRVKSVKAIAEEIKVHYPGAVAHTDEDIAHRALSVLKWDVLLPKDAVQVTVENGWVSLSGEVGWDYQRRAAADDVRKLFGVIGVTNQIDVKPHLSPIDVSQRIQNALSRGAEIEAKAVRVSCEGGKVRLEGTVHSLRERDAVERAAWAAPGVRSVEDRVLIG